MAKRARGSTTRPGQRARLARQAPRPATLTTEEEARAAELEAAIVAQERAAETATRSARARSQRTDDALPVAAASGGTIAARAASEYAYVARDIRRIAVIAGALLATLFGLFIVVTATGIGPF